MGPWRRAHRAWCPGLCYSYRWPRRAFYRLRLRRRHWTPRGRLRRVYCLVFVDWVRLLCPRSGLARLWHVAKICAYFRRSRYPPRLLWRRSGAWSLSSRRVGVWPARASGGFFAARRLSSGPSRHPRPSYRPALEAWIACRFRLARRLAGLLRLSEHLAWLAHLAGLSRHLFARPVHLSTHLVWPARLVAHLVCLAHLPRPVFLRGARPSTSRPSRWCRVSGF